MISATAPPDSRRIISTIGTSANQPREVCSVIENHGRTRGQTIF